MIISEQIRAARQLVRVTAEQLASLSGVGIATIRRYDAIGIKMEVIPVKNNKTLLQ